MLRCEEMSTSPVPPPQHHWPLRLVLVTTLLALVLAGSVLESSANRATGSSAATSTTSLTTASTSTTTPTTTTTTLATALPTSLDQRSRGCGLAMSGQSLGPTSPTRTVPIAPIGQCKVLEIGDSLGSDLGWGLSRELASTHSLKLIQMDKSSSGLAAAWFYNWPRQLKSMLAHFHPNLLIVCIGGDDEQGIRVSGHSYDFNTTQWRARYTTLIRQIDISATRAGSYVLWVGLPIMAPATYRAGVAALNWLYRSVAITVPGVTFLPTWSLFADARSKFRYGAEVNHVLSAIRSPDGIHFSVVGENVFATYVAQRVASIYRVSIKLDQPAFITG